VFEAYHCKCIDPWLTEKRNTCPLCKDVVGRRHGNEAAVVDETQPLLNAQDDSENTVVTNAGNIFVLICIHSSIEMYCQLVSGTSVIYSHFRFMLICLKFS